MARTRVGLIGSPEALPALVRPLKGDGRKTKAGSRPWTRVDESGREVARAETVQAQCKVGGPGCARTVTQCDSQDAVVVERHVQEGRCNGTVFAGARANPLDARPIVPIPVRIRHSHSTIARNPARFTLHCALDHRLATPIGLDSRPFLPLARPNDVPGRPAEAPRGGISSLGAPPQNQPTHQSERTT